MTPPRLTDIEQRANAATDGPWEADDNQPFSMELQGIFAPDKKRYVLKADFDEQPDNPGDADFIAHTRQDVPALTAVVRAVLELHKPKHAIFSWKTGLRYEDPCTTCHGKAGIHECGCWAEGDTVHVCEPCDQPGGTERATWPCRTVQAITEHLDT